MESGQSKCLFGPILFQYCILRHRYAFITTVNRKKHKEYLYNLQYNHQLSNYKLNYYSHYRWTKGCILIKGIHKLTVFDYLKHDRECNQCIIKLRKERIKFSIYNQFILIYNTYTAYLNWKVLFVWISQVSRFVER